MARATKRSKLYVAITIETTGEVEVIEGMNRHWLRLA